MQIDVPADPGMLAGYIEGLARHNMRLGMTLPTLDSAGVRYKREPKGQEQWQDAKALLRSKIGDCEDLVAYELARLWDAGIVGARAEVVRVKALMHVYIRMPDGTIYDPSLARGMKNPGWRYYTMETFDDDYSNERDEVEKAAAASVGCLPDVEPPRDDMAGADDVIDVEDEDVAALEAVVGGATSVVEGDATSRWFTDAGYGYEDHADTQEAAAPAPAVKARAQWVASKDGAALALPLRDGRVMRATTAIAGRKGLAKVAQEVLKRAVSDPTVASLLPPGSVAVATAIARLSKMSRADVRRRAKKAVSAAGRALAAVFS